MRQTTKLLAVVALLVLGFGFSSLSRAEKPAGSLTSKDIDSLLVQELGKSALVKVAGDEQFLRRASLDLIGRPPTPDELAAFIQDTAADKRAKTIDRLLDSKEFGQNWGNYWSDVISYRVPPPELTFLSYKGFKAWLADRLNAGAAWDELTRDLLTASGVVKTNPAATYVGYHKGDAQKLGAETARVFLGLQLQCAQCHNHKFDRWTRKEFHGLAAFFARAGGTLGGLDGSGTAVKDKGKGEYVMPDVDPKKKGTTLAPAEIDGQTFKLDMPDDDRRAALAKWLTAPENPWFAQAYVNRVWARLMGRGFYDPVDDMADYRTHLLPKTHEAMASHFAASKFDIKGFFRMVMNSQAYQQEQQVMARADQAKPPVLAKKLRGDEVYASLAVAVGLPNFTPPPQKATGEVRFPPPPKSTCDLVSGQFGFDPSYAPEEVSRTLGQAMFLMNNDQLHKQINADPKSGTLLSKLLAKETDDKSAVTALYLQALARKPSDKELKIAIDYIQSVGQRGAAFEDLMWSLVNSAEFTTRK